MLLFIIKTLLGMLPNKISSIVFVCGKNYSTRSSNGIKLVVPQSMGNHLSLIMLHGCGMNFNLLLH